MGQLRSRPFAMTNTLSPTSLTSTFIVFQQSGKDQVPQTQPQSERPRSQTVCSDHRRNEHSGQSKPPSSPTDRRVQVLPVHLSCSTSRISLACAPKTQQSPQRQPRTQPSS